MRSTWTDSRLDDFAANTDRRFDAVDRRFDKVDDEASARSRVARSARCSARSSQVGGGVIGGHRRRHRAVVIATQL